VLANVVDKSGAWFNFKNMRLGQGRENSKQFLKDNREIAGQIRQAVLQAKGYLGGRKSEGAAEE
jgi:recombination protein RecA